MIQAVERDKIPYPDDGWEYAVKRKGKPPPLLMKTFLFSMGNWVLGQMAHRGYLALSTDYQSKTFPAQIIYNHPE